MKRFLVLFIFPLVVFAGKPEREYQKNELTPSVKAAEEKFHGACGCSLKISIKETLASINDMTQAKNICDGVKDGVEGYCTDADSKKEICKMKTLEITKGGVGFTFSGNRGVASTDGNSYPNFGMMTAELDK